MQKLPRSLITITKSTNTRQGVIFSDAYGADQLPGAAQGIGGPGAEWLPSIQVHFCPFLRSSISSPGLAQEERAS